MLTQLEMAQSFGYIDSFSDVEALVSEVCIDCMVLTANNANAKN